MILLTFLAQASDTIRMSFHADSAALIVPHTKTGLLEALPAAASAAGLILTAVSITWAGHQWKRQYFTAEWGRITNLLLANPKFCDPVRNERYNDIFAGDDACQYEMIARISIAFVDDVFHLKGKKYLKKWFQGSVGLFVGTHKQWFLDHQAAYSKQFVAEMRKLLEI